MLQPQHDGGESWDAYTTNAAPALVQEDGSVLLVYRGQQHHVSPLPRWAARFTTMTLYCRLERHRRRGDRPRARRQLGGSVRAAQRRAAALQRSLRGPLHLPVSPDWPRCLSGRGVLISPCLLNFGLACSGRRGWHMVMHHMPPSDKRPASFPYNRSAWACGIGENACVGHA